MFGHQRRVYSEILLAADILVGFSALALAYFARTLVDRVPLELSDRFNPVLLPFKEYLLYFLMFVPVWWICLSLTQRYPRLFHLELPRQLSRVLQFVGIVGFLMGFLTYTFKLEVSRPIFFGFLVLSAVFLGANRVLFHGVLRSRKINEHNQTNILVVGSAAKAARISSELGALRQWGFNVVGYLTTDEVEVSDGPCLGKSQDLSVLLLDRVVVDEIIFVGSELADLAALEEMLQLCGELGIRTRVVPDFFPASVSSLSVDFLENLPLITFSMVPEQSVSLVAKRVVDFLVASSCLILLSPLILLISAAIKFTSEGPILYLQKRRGLFGRTFTLYKFRTMVDGAEDKLWEIRHLNEMSGPVFKMRNDPRVTPLGRLLRKFSIDEIPQFWNVIKGEMSVVGPRAPLSEEVRHYTNRQRRRLSVKPGITCLWQVAGRNEIDFQKWMDMDLQYIDSWSIWLDIHIMLKTIPAVFTGRGAR